MGRLTILAGVLASLLPGALALAQHDEGRLVPGELTLITQPGVTLADVQAAHPGLSLTNLRTYTPPQIYLVGVPVGQEEAYEIELGADRTLVRVAEENRTVASPEEGTTQSLFLRSTESAYRTQASLAQINAGGVGRSTARPGTLVAILDTGVAPHPDLAGRIVPGGWNFILDSDQVDEMHCAPGDHLVGHGTYVAGLIALVDPDAQFFPVTVLGCDGVGSAFAVACGIYEAIEHGAGVINMSFATTMPSDVTETAIHDAAAAGIMCVSSVSNAGRDTGNDRSYPAEYEWAIGVGAVDHSSGAWARAPFSDWGRSLDLAAPGVAVTGLHFDGAEFGYANGSGTSYSAAWVSGVCSLLHAKYGPHGSEWTFLRLCGAADQVDVGAPFGMGCDHRDDGIAAILNARRAVCPADFNADEFVDHHDYRDFVDAFELGDAAADVNGDAFVDFFDYDDYLAAFEAGC